MDKDLESIATFGQYSLYNPKGDWCEKFYTNLATYDKPSVIIMKDGMFGNILKYKTRLRKNSIVQNLFIENPTNSSQFLQNMLYDTINDFWLTFATKSRIKLENGNTTNEYRNTQEHIEVLEEFLSKHRGKHLGFLFSKELRVIRKMGLSLEGGHEIGNRTGGVDDNLSLMRAEIDSPVMIYGLPKDFLVPIYHHFKSQDIVRNYPQILLEPVRKYREGKIKESCDELIFNSISERKRLHEEEGWPIESPPSSLLYCDIEGNALKAIEWASNGPRSELTFNRAMSSVVDYMLEKLKAN